MKNGAYDSYTTQNYLQPPSMQESATSRQPPQDDDLPRGTSFASASSYDSPCSSRPQSGQSTRFARAWDSPNAQTAKPVQQQHGRKTPNRPEVIEEVGFEGRLRDRYAQQQPQQPPAITESARQLLQDEIADFAEQIGINPHLEPHLMDIAEDFYACPLPEGWQEYWTAEDCVYYAVADKGHTQWEHPMEHFYKAHVFLRREGFKRIAREQSQNPPTMQEIHEMASYLGVDLKEEKYLEELVRQAVGAPLPPKWREDRTGIKYLHESGAISNNHPLDVYFLETIRRRREDLDRIEREGNEKIEQDHRANIAKILKAKHDKFQVLGLLRSASKKDIRLRYRALALEVHPDKNKQPGADQAFQVLNAAFRECMEMMQATYHR